jgi:hypothetical protein
VWLSVRWHRRPRAPFNVEVPTSRSLPAAVAIYLQRTDGYYCYTSSTTSWYAQSPWYETLVVTVGGTVPKPSSTGGAIRNTVAYTGTLDLSGPGWFIPFSQQYTGRYVAIQIQ